jgi:hypothetical protein
MDTSESCIISPLPFADPLEDPFAEPFAPCDAATAAVPADERRFLAVATGYAAGFDGRFCAAEFKAGEAERGTSRAGASAFPRDAGKSFFRRPNIFTFDTISG